MEENQPKLYKVISTNQQTVQDMTTYVLAFNASDIEEEYADVVSIMPITNFDDITEE